MSTTTTLYTQINYRYKSYNHKYEVEDDYKDASNYVDSLKRQLRDLTMITEPLKFMTKESMEQYEDGLDWLNSKYNEVMVELDDAIMEKYKLEVLLNEWDACHNEKGEAIPPPKDFGYKPYMTGDFVKLANENKE